MSDHDSTRVIFFRTEQFPEFRGILGLDIGHQYSYWRSPFKALVMAFEKTWLLGERWTSIDAGYIDWCR